MPNLQTEIFGWAAAQPALTGVVVLAAGVVYAFFGFRVFRFLLGVSCAGLGWAIGATAAALAHQPIGLPGLILAVLAGAVSLKWEKPGVIAASGATWGVLGIYLAVQVHVPEVGALITGGFAAVLGALFGWLCFRTTRVILTTLQGTVLMILGFVATSTHLLPAVGVTFRQWASSQSLVVPIFLAMLFAAAYSYQAMHQQGDIRTGK